MPRIQVPEGGYHKKGNVLVTFPFLTSEPEGDLEHCVQRSLRVEAYVRIPAVIFAEIGEEWGFLGSAGVLVLFTILTISGFALAIQTHDTFGRIFALGLSCTIFCPAMLNMMVVTAILPNTGLPLPFISSGGTNLVFTIASIGLLTSIQRYTPIIRQNYWPTRRQNELQSQ